MTAKPGAILWLSLSVICPIVLRAAPQRVTFVQSDRQLDVYDYVEVTATVEKPDVANPFTDAFVEGDFGVDGDKSVHVDGFCDSYDGSIFRIRFMPTRPGEYVYQVKYGQGPFVATKNGRFVARDAKRPGLLRIDEKHPWHFIWEGTGEHYFWNGTTTYYLMGWQDHKAVKEIIDRLASLKINRLRVLLYGRNHDRPWGQPVRSTKKFKLYLNPWMAERPHDVKNPGFDLKRFNVAHWQKYERLLRHARDKDVIVSVIPFIGGQVLPTPFAAYSKDEDRYYRYAVARFAAFSNVTWDLGNEHNFHRQVPKWADYIGPKVKQWDPYDHLTSAHNVVYRTPGKTWNDMQLIQRWDAGQNRFMLDQRLAQEKTGRIIPQVNEEYGYQDLWEKYPGHRASETRRKLAWEIYMAGCCQTAGETANRGTGLGADSGGGWVNGRGDKTMTMLTRYAHIVEFFSAFEWWKAEPKNHLVSGAAMCLTVEPEVYAIYLPAAQHVTIRLARANYRAKWFNPRTGGWLSAPQANGPVWTSPEPPDDGDWVMLLHRTSDLVDTAPPRLVSALAGGEGRRIFAEFSEVIEPRSAADIGNYEIDKGVEIEAAALNTGGTKVMLTTSLLSEGAAYTLTVRNIKDRASKPNAMARPATMKFRFAGAMQPIVELCFDEGSGRQTANAGISAAKHPCAKLTKSKPIWAARSAPLGGKSALDFGSQIGEFAADLEGGPVDALKGIKSFTITGWLNCRDARIGSGGNRIVTTINNGGEGFDLVFLRDGRLQIGINQWPDGVPAKSSAGRISVDPKAGPDNWRFFAVTYDSTRRDRNVKFYFGTSRRPTAFDSAVDYARGPVGHNTGPLTVGHFNLLTRPNHADRMFRGLIDEVRVFASKTDKSGALTSEQIRSIQQRRADK